MQNAATAQKTIADGRRRLAAPRTCACKDALATAIITRPEHVPEQTQEGTRADHRQVHQSMKRWQPRRISLSCPTY